MSTPDEYLLDEFDDLIDTEEKRTQFTGLTDDNMADWAAMRLEYHESQAERFEANAKRLIEQIETKCKEDQKRELKEAKFFRDELVIYAERRRAEAPKDKNGEPVTKTFPLPRYDLATTYKNPIPKIANQELAVKWAKANGKDDFIVRTEIVTERVDLSKIKELNTGSKIKAELYAGTPDNQMVDPTTGEPIEGVELTVGELTVKPKKRVTDE